MSDNIKTVLTRLKADIRKNIWDMPVNERSVYGLNKVVDETIDMELANVDKQSNVECHKHIVMPRFYFTRFHKGTEHSGWEIAILGIVLKWMKFPDFKQYAYWRCANFGKIAMWDRSIEFTLPRLKNGA